MYNENLMDSIDRNRLNHIKTIKAQAEVKKYDNDIIIQFANEIEDRITKERNILREKEELFQKFVDTENILNLYIEKYGKYSLEKPVGFYSHGKDEIVLPETTQNKFFNLIEQTILRTEKGKPKTIESEKIREYFGKDYIIKITKKG